MYLLGIDLGTSSIKVCVIEASTKREIVSAQYPDVEVEISSPQKGWAEQDPELWWSHTQEAIKRVVSSGKFEAKKIASIGISYQMHGLVMVDKNKKVLRPSIIWCDSRAVNQGNSAFEKMGSDTALSHLLNSPGNFTAAKLAWVKENEPEVFAQCDKIMLPGDFIAMKMTGEVTATNSGLSEGIFWDFKNNCVSEAILKVFGFSSSLLPNIKPVFSNHGEVLPEVANLLGINAGVPISYKAGDQPNNALSLNVVNPGEIAATAGTSGVVYAVSDQVTFDPKSRINSFAHVNHGVDSQNRIGILLCINGTGILNRWLKDNMGGGISYQEMNKKAAQVTIGSNGLVMMPFGNGSERMLQNQLYGGQVLGLDFNIHNQSHLFRAGQEGIVFSMKYGFDIMKTLGVLPNVIRAGSANMFLSDIFAETMVNVTQVPVELYDTNGAKGAALGGGVGAGVYTNIKESMEGLELIKMIEPNKSKKDEYAAAYQNWLQYLNV
jgi:xylulokinase